MKPGAAPAISVLVPVYNAAPYIRDSIASVRTQTVSDLEIVVVDDGSTDASHQILLAEAAQDARIRVISRPNRGLIATRNELLAEARGDVVAWMDADDLSLPHRLERQLALLRSDDRLACVGCNTRMIDNRGRRLGPEVYRAEHEAILRDQAEGTGMRFPATIVHRAIALRAGGFREPFRIGEDLDFLLRVGELGRLANLQEEQYLYRQHLSSTCSSFGNLWLIYRDEILSLARERRETGSDRLQRGETIRMPPAQREEADLVKPDILAAWSTMARAEGDSLRALEYAVRSTLLAPKRKVGWRAVRRVFPH